MRVKWITTHTQNGIPVCEQRPVILVFDSGKPHSAQKYPEWIADYLILICLLSQFITGSKFIWKKYVGVQSQWHVS